MSNPRVLVTIEGGNIQSIAADGAIEVNVVDIDNDSVYPSERLRVVDHVVEVITMEEMTRRIDAVVAEESRITSEAEHNAFPDGRY